MSTAMERWEVEAVEHEDVIGWLTWHTAGSLPTNPTVAQSFLECQ